MLFAHLKPLLFAVETALLFAAHSNASPTPTSGVAYTQKQARELALSQLPDSVRRDLESRSADEYELHFDHLLKRDSSAPANGSVETCGNGKDIATAYYGGPSNKTKELADLWHEDGHHITFFVNVNNNDCGYNSPYPEDLQYAMSLGHIVGSNSGTQPSDFTTLTMEQIDEQIQLVETYTWDTFGVVPRFFHPPNGRTNDTLNAYLASRWGLTVVTGSINADDREGASTQDAIAKATQAPPGSIIFYDESSESSVREEAPAVIEYYKKNNITSVNMSKCAHERPYKAVSRYIPKRDPSWDCKARNVPAPGQSSV